MAFYLNPPSGNISLASVEKYAKARLEFLLKVARCHGNSLAMQDIVMDAESVKFADCLTEGSTKDQISHYVLRLACAGDREMSSFYSQAESYFFRYRVSCMTEDELLCHVVRPLQKLGTLLIAEQKPLAPAMLEIAEILGYMTYTWDIETIIRFFVEGAKNKFFVLRFQHVLQLVAGRAVELRRGKAVVPCTRLCEVLEVIFRKMLTYGMSLAKRKYSAAVQDRRFHRLFSRLKAIFFSQLSTLRGGQPSLFGVVRAEEVPALSDYLPLCMSTLYRLLKQRHRLRHADRIQLTLYLKEMGMPVHEALHFWRLEYSKPADCPKGGHDQSWSQNARRYTYNIRHLYGLEGARINYRGHCCTALQGRLLGPLEAGGCPFSNCDADSLSQLLSKEGIPEQHQQSITSLASEGLPQSACQVFFLQKLTTTLGTEVLPSGSRRDCRIKADCCKRPHQDAMIIQECLCEQSGKGSTAERNKQGSGRIKSELLCVGEKEEQISCPCAKDVLDFTKVSCQVCDGNASEKIAKELPFLHNRNHNLIKQEAMSCAEAGPCAHVQTERKSITPWKRKAVTGWENLDDSNLLKTESKSIQASGELMFGNEVKRMKLHSCQAASTSDDNIVRFKETVTSQKICMKSEDDILSSKEAATSHKVCVKSKVITKSCSENVTGANGENLGCLNCHKQNLTVSTAYTQKATGSFEQIPSSCSTRTSYLLSSCSLSGQGQKSHTGKSAQGCTCVLKGGKVNIDFLKPADYSTSFKKLLEGLMK